MNRDEDCFWENMQASVYGRKILTLDEARRCPPAEKKKRKKKRKKGKPK